MWKRLREKNDLQNPKKIILDNFVEYVFSVLLILSVICGFIYKLSGGIKNTAVLIAVLIVAICLGLFVCQIIGHTMKYTISPSKQSFSLLENICFYMLICLAVQLPLFLAFYPGICTYDLGVQINQYESGEYITNHPLMHTLYVGFFKNLFANANIGYAVSNIIQMLLMDYTIGYAMKKIYIQCKNVLWVFAVLLNYAVCPIYSFMSFSSTKDIFFSLFVFIAVVVVLDGEIKGIRGAFLIITMSLALMFRNNAIYAFVPTYCIVLRMNRKYKRSFNQLLIYGILILILSVGANKLLISTLDANEGSIKEMLSVPAQGMARIYNYTADDDEKELIREYIEEPERYKTYISDPIKEQLPFDVLDSKCKHFLLDSALLCLKHPIVFIDSFMSTTQGYWDVFHAPYQSEYSYLASDNARGGAEHDSKFVALEQICMKYLKTSSYIEKTLILSLFCNNGLYIWIIGYCFIRSLKKKNKEVQMVTLFLIIYLGTLFAGPGAFVRYSFQFELCAPIIFLKVLSDKEYSQ